MIPLCSLMAGAPMASITIRNLDQSIKTRLRVRAAHHGRSMEEEARDILRSVLCEEHGPPGDLAAAIHRRFASLGGVELSPPPRDPIRDVPTFDE
jgi:antitoxin FitA